MPTLTDQGEGIAGPSRTAAEDSADILPLTSSREEPNDRSALRRGIDAAVGTDQSKGLFIAKQPIPPAFA